MIVDGTQDISGIEQQSICLRYIDDNLEPQEKFVGMYEPPETTGSTIAKCIVDVLLRLNLPMSMLRGQTYDGAANMSGAYNGCQAVIRESQPLALYVHCGAHCMNLVAQKTCAAVVVVRDSVYVVQELGSVFSSSISCRTTYARITADQDNVHKIKPLCPTRWLVRVNAIREVILHHGDILDTLQELSATGNQVATRAQGLYTQLIQTSTLLGLHMAVAVLAPLEQLNCRLQSRTETVAGMLECVELVKQEVSALRTNVQFDCVVEECSSRAAQLGLDELQVPRTRRPPARFTGPAAAHSATTPENFYRPKFFELIDTAITELENRFSGSAGLRALGRLERVLIDGVIDGDLLRQYEELNTDDLAMQLPMFRRTYTVNKLADCVTALRTMSPDMRKMFGTVENLVRLIMVCPCSSAEAERSFSSLRRLKTWLRSTMSQSRLNSVAICHSHQEMLDAADVSGLMKEFAGRCDARLNLFGRW